MKSREEIEKMGEKSAKNPASLEYGHHVGAPAFRPENLTSVQAMHYDRSESWFNHRLKKLSEEYKKLISEFDDNRLVYEAECRFTPKLGEIYHLYEGKDRNFLSIIGPKHWEQKHIGSFRFGLDSVWEKVQ